MCGLAGYISTASNQNNVELDVRVRGMVDTLLTRGPDDIGVWVDEGAGVAIGHRRLSVVDLSNAGRQPMISDNGRYVLAFNGEVYNHLALRLDLKSAGVVPAWRGHSDTETLLSAFEVWGLEETLRRCVGMFSIVLWDRQENNLILARDRFGEKPLYYGWLGRDGKRVFAFGSELKALHAYPGFSATVCRFALAQYLRFMYVPAPRSIYQDIYKLEPGCLLIVQGHPPEEAPKEPLRPGQRHGNMQVRRWWSLSEVVESGARTLITSEEEAVCLLENQLSEAVALQASADVPLGAFLSGGVDSSTVVALMQYQSSRPVQTFTIGSDQVGFDESPQARAVARHLGTDHYEMRVSPQMAQDLIPHLPYIYDEPFADSSQIPTHLICKAAHQRVTVALSGDGGDELFGGYNRHFWGARVSHYLSWMPKSLRVALGRVIATVPIGAWDVLLGSGAQSASNAGGVVRIGEKLHKLALRLQTIRNIDDLYLSLVSEWQDPASLLRGAVGGRLEEPSSLLNDPLPLRGVGNEQLRMMYLDAVTYLPDDILCKVDRAAMATSLETRAPFLDHRVVELAWRLPLHMKIRGNEGKWALRRVLYRHVPRELIDRPKAGFSIPLGEWLRGPLRDWAEGLLGTQRLENEGYFDPDPIRQCWNKHIERRSDCTPRLWSILMFQAWLEAMKTNKKGVNHAGK